MDSKKVVIYSLCIVMITLHYTSCPAQGKSYISGEEYSHILYRQFDSLSNLSTKFSFEDLGNPLRYFHRRKSIKNQQHLSSAFLQKFFVKNNNTVNIICEDYDSIIDFFANEQSCVVVASQESLIEGIPVYLLYIISGSGIIQENVFIFKTTNEGICLSCVYTVPRSIIELSKPSEVTNINKWGLDYDCVRLFL